MDEPGLFECWFLNGHPDMGVRVVLQRDYHGCFISSI